MRSDAAPPGMSLARQAALFGVILLAYLATAAGHLDSPDAELQFRTTQSLALRGTTAIEPIDPDGFATRAGRGGAQYAQYGVGLPVLALPFYHLGEAIDAALPDVAVHRLFWPTTQYHDGTPRAWRLRLGVSLFNQVAVAALALLFLRVAMRLGLEASEALVATLLLAFGTYHWAHSRTFFSEPAAAALVFAAFALLVGWHQEGGAGRWRPLAAGLLAGAALLVRKDSALFYPGLCLYAMLPAILAPGRCERGGEGEDGERPAAAGFCWDATAFRRLLPGALIAASGMIAGIALHLFIAWLQYGDATALGYEDQPEGISFSTPLIAGLYGFLFSMGKGLFFFSPALLLGVLGLPRLWRRAPVAALGAALTVAPFFLAMCMWRNWAGGWCWGPRHLFQIHVFLALGFVGWLATDEGGRARDDVRRAPLGRRRRLATWLFLIVGAGVQIYGASQSPVDFYMTHFRMREPPTARALYTPGEAAEYLVALQRPDGSTSGLVPLSVAGITAPINDSVYVPQNTQWYGNAAMWQAGMNDLLLLHVLRPDERGPGLLPAPAPASSPAPPSGPR